MPILATEHVPIPSKDLLSWMLDNPTYDVDEPIYIDAADTTRSISHRQATELTKRLAAGFREAGLQKGDVVCMHAFNDIEYSMSFLGTVAAGGIFAGTNPSYTAYELAHAIKTADIKFFVVEPNLLPNVLKAAQQTGLPESNIIVFNIHNEPVPPNLRSWKGLQSHGSIEWERFDSEEQSKSSTAARLFSSGTTGLPKALNMTHHNFISQHTLVQEYKARPYQIRRLICNPMFHVSQVPRSHTSPLRGGYKTFIMRRFELNTWLVNMKRFEISECNLVPMMVVNVLNSGNALVNKATFATVRNTWSGAAPLDSALQARFKKFLGDDVPFNQVWGMSETSCILTMLYYPESDSTGCVGRAIPNHDVKLVDDDGNDITEYGVRGELCVRGPCIVPGYYKNEKATRDSWDKDGYFHTGDIAYCGKENRCWYIVDRKKELIKVRGFQVAPAELEGVLYDHPEIMDAAVIGIQRSKEESELPRAYVVKRPGSDLTEEDVRQYSSSRLARYKNLDGGIKFVDSLPKNASGKFLKNQLRDWANRELGARL